MKRRRRRSVQPVPRAQRPIARSHRVAFDFPAQPWNGWEQWAAVCVGAAGVFLLLGAFERWQAG